MSRRVLVPYDSSEPARSALEHALRVFGDAEVVLLHVVEPADGESEVENPTDTRQIETGENLVEGVRDWYDESERERIEPVVRYGRPVHEVLEYVDRGGINHVVVGSHGRDGAARLLLGSVAETVVRRSPVPVTVVREGGRESETPDQVVVPFDASTDARRALEFALDRFEGADITALYVSTPPTRGIDRAEAIVGMLEDWTEERSEHVESVLGVAEELAAEHDRSIRTRSVEGGPADTIVEYAEGGSVDHVVVGSTGRDGIARLLLGSVAETVVRRSPVTVTVAK